MARQECTDVCAKLSRTKQSRIIKKRDGGCGDVWLVRMAGYYVKLDALPGGISSGHFSFATYFTPLL